MSVVYVYYLYEIKIGQSCCLQDIVLNYKESDGDVTGWIPSEKAFGFSKPNNLKSSKKTC